MSNPYQSPQTVEPPARSHPQQPSFDPVVLGTACGLISAVVYTAANICLRSVADEDPAWVSAVKTIPMALLMGPWLVWNSRRGVPGFTSRKILGLIACAAVMGQIGGNVSFQWALGEIGVALTVPLSLGGMIVAASILGRFALNEPITTRAAISIVVLLAAIFVLSLGADEARQSVVKVAADPWRLTTGVAAACFAGLAYCVLNVAIRYSFPRGATLPGMLFTISLVGMFCLGVLSLYRIGLPGILSTEPAVLAMMLLAGVCNCVAFVALSKSLQLISVVYVNALNATQATMAALAGIVFFQEAASSSLIFGVGLTIIGLLFMRQKRKLPGNRLEEEVAVES